MKFVLMSVIRLEFYIIVILLVSCVLEILSSSSVTPSQNKNDSGNEGKEFVSFVKFDSSDKLRVEGSRKVDEYKVEEEIEQQQQDDQGHDLEQEQEEDYSADELDQDDQDEDKDKDLTDIQESGRSDQDQDQDDDFERDFRKEDLINAVTELERDAQFEEQSSLLPQILGLFSQPDRGGLDFEWDNHQPPGTSHGHVNRAKINDSTLPEDLTELSEDIVDDIAAGVEESLLLSDDSSLMNMTKTRQFSIYMFQGQYVPESRLNRFVDGAIRNMGGELRIAVMDPLYFRVLPRGQVESRQKPIGKLRTDIVTEPNWEEVGTTRVARAGFLDRLKNKVIQKKVVVNVNTKNPTGKKRKVVAGTRRGIKNRRRKPGLGQRRPNNKKNRNKNRNRNQNRRRKFFRRRKRKPQGNRRRPNNKKKKNQQKKNKNRRQKRRVRRNVGGGRVEGLSVISRDGDAEMQVFGNYTLIRSHMKMGPVELSMQFRTRRGLRRTGATLPVIRMHTVTRVNMEGSEMIDFLLDRPHPESIKVRGKLFPLAQRIARNIFARLFMPNSFLVSRLREKASMALLSKPKANK